MCVIGSDEVMVVWGASHHMIAVCTEVQTHKENDI